MDWPIKRQRSCSLGHLHEIDGGQGSLSPAELRSRSRGHAVFGTSSNINRETEYVSDPVINHVSQSSSSSSLKREVKKRVKRERKIKLQQQYEEAKLQKQKRRRRRWSPDEAKTRAGRLLNNIASAWYSLFDDKTYIVVNQHGTTFRFSESKSLFLFERNSRLRQFCINLFIRPLFSHFIMLVILANCVCMMLAEPPTWIDSHLEYVFTAIYCFEAGIKIIGRGFVLHRFSYLRDPWNWLDFIVIVFAIITEVLKVAMSSSGGEANGELSQLSVLRAFRVLRALKTMSVVPGLRGIVKALLRSIRALQDAVALTIFCVSVFALIGYQLFHGTLRNKCVLIPGYIDDGPDAIYMSDIGFTPISASESQLYKDFNQLSIVSDQTSKDSFISSFSIAPVYNTSCAGFTPCGSESNSGFRPYWTTSDTNLTETIFRKTGEQLANLSSTAFHSEAHECSELLDECVAIAKFDTRTYDNSSLLHTSTTFSRNGEPDSVSRYWGCRPIQEVSSALKTPQDFFFTTTFPVVENTTLAPSRIVSECNVSVVAFAGNISCIYRNLQVQRNAINSSDRIENHRCFHNHSWVKMMHFGELFIKRWQTRKSMILFRLYPRSQNKARNESAARTYLIAEEYRRKEMPRETEKEWDCNKENYVMRNIDAGMFFYVNSSNRPDQEPLYCKLGDESVCPKSHECREAGGNPDFGYTNFDHFFWAFLTSFRLINQDAWSRLYYLTLHTIGEGYVVFYIFVMFLGSYYLINLILAVVYMAYEEQQASTEDEALEEEEHKAERRELQPSSDDERGSRSKEECDNGSRSSVRSCCAAEEGRSFGLITTSLTSIADSGGMRKSYRSSRRHRYGHRRPPVKVDLESELLYRKYTKKYGDGMSHECIDNLSCDADRDRYAIRGRRARVRQDSVASTGSFRTVSERNTCSRCSSRDDPTSRSSVGYCPQCRIRRKSSLRKSKSNSYTHRRRLAAIKNESAIAPAEPQVKLVITSDAAAGDIVETSYSFLTAGQTPKPVGALLKTSNLDVLAVDYAPGRSPSIYSTASEGNYEAEIESDDTSKQLGEAKSSDLLKLRESKQNPVDFRPKSSRCGLLVVPLDHSSSSSVSMSSNSELVDGGEQVVKADVTAHNTLTPPPSCSGAQKSFGHGSGLELNHSPSLREPDATALSENENNSALARQVPSLMITSASSEHIVSLCKKDLDQERAELTRNGAVGLYAKQSLPVIAGSPNLSSVHSPSELRSPHTDLQDRMSDSGLLSGRNRQANNRRRRMPVPTQSSLDLVDTKSCPGDHRLAAFVIDNLQQSHILPSHTSPSHRFRFFDKEPESHEMLLINGFGEKAAISEIAANVLSIEENPGHGRKGRSLKKIAKSQLRAAKQTTVDIFCKWSCCTPQWEALQTRVRSCVLDPFMDLFITLCIFLNTFFMTLERHPADDSHVKLLEDANLVFTTIFSLEMFFKVIGLGPYTYFREAWNMFDAVVVISSLLEIILQKIPGLSVLRAFRLMRILKLAKSWPTLNKLLRIIGKTLGKLWHLTIVFLLVLFIFAVVGMQLLRDNYKEAFKKHGAMPRWNFVDFPHAFMVVFRIQCGEWIENMFACMNVAPTGICITLFILVLVIGNLVILNLFLALLLNSFSGDALQRTDAERNSLAVAWRRILRCIRRGTRTVTGSLGGCSAISNCCSKLQLQLCLKHCRVSPSDETAKARKKRKAKLNAEPSRTEATMLPDSDTEAHNERRNNNHVEVISGTKPSSQALLHSTSAKTGPSAEEEMVVGKPPTTNQSVVNEAKDVTVLKCLACHREFPYSEAKPNYQHRKRARIREGFAPAAAFQNRPDETNDVVGSQCGDGSYPHPKKYSHGYEFARTSSEDRSKITSAESNTSDSVRHSRKRRSKRHKSENIGRWHSNSDKVKSKNVTMDKDEEEKPSRQCDADEMDLLLNGNTAEQDSIPPGRSRRHIRSRRKSNMSTSTRQSSPSTRFHQSLSRSDSQGSGQWEDGQGNDNKEPEIPQCFPPFWTNGVDGRWWKIRTFFYNVAVHRYFENVVIFCILLSSVALAFEDIHLHNKPSLAKVLDVLDKFFCTFFTIEMLIKWTGFGLRYYFTNAWCLLDFVIVFFSLLDLCLSLTGGASEQLGALRVLRTFRALRPLRALSRFQGMKVVVDALVRAIPSIFHVFLVCVIVWLIFSILGVNFFGGQFGRCVMFHGNTGVILPRRDNSTTPGSDVNIIETCTPNSSFPLSESDAPAVRNKEECRKCANLMNTTKIQWIVPSVNFDNVGQGFLALMQVATFKGWLEIMASAVDITGVEEQPSYEYSFHNYFYFCIFIVFGAFFSLNLFIGVIIDNFNQQKVKCSGGEDGVFLTDEQKRYYNAMKRMAAKAPSKPIPRPNSWFANKIYNVVTDRKFEMGVMAMILLNMVVMAIEHYDMSDELDKVLENLNLFFICVFFLEAVLKLIGLRWYYFTVVWNVFDIIVVVVSIIATALSEMIEKYLIQPTLFRIIRLFRVTRILRLIREAKGIRTLLFALMMSLPALFNIGSLLFLVVFIYAILGMSQFAYVQKIAGLDDILNFETFPNTFLVLFQVSTSEGWNTFIEPILRDKEPLCDPNIDTPVGNGNCGNAAVGVAYFVTFVLITFLIVINMYIAIILENFEVATRESAEPLTADDFEQFFEVWQRYDDKLTQYVTIEQLQHFLHHLDYPLRVPFPNRAFIVNARMKITRTGRIHCLEVILALIKKVLGDSPELETLKDAMLQSFLLKCKTKETVEEGEMIDTVEYERRRRAAIVIQKAYKKWKNPTDLESDSSDCETDSGSSQPG